MSVFKMPSWWYFVSSLGREHQTAIMKKKIYDRRCEGRLGVNYVKGNGGAAERGNSICRGQAVGSSKAISQVTERERI